MSYSDNLNSMKEKYPFERWKGYDQYGLTGYTDENCNAAQEIFDDLISKLIRMGKSAREKEKEALFEIAVEALNDFNVQTNLIETGERDELCSLFDHIAEAAGLDSSKYADGDGIATEWREW